MASAERKDFWLDFYDIDYDYAYKIQSISKIKKCQSLK
jgi:hypothetical protein